MRLDPPKKFSFRPEEWPEWSTEFRRFRTAGKLHLEDGEIQRDTLIYCMGQEAEKIYRTLTFDEEGESDSNFDCLMQKFTNYFIPKRNIIYERSQFQERKQKESETIEEFYRVLKDLVRFCNYGNEEESIIRDRFVVGLIDQKLKEKLQLIHDLTLKKALETARQHELIKSQMKAQQAEVDLVSKKQFNSFRPSSSKSSNHKANCGRCGRQHFPGQCPAHGKECLKCGGKNHFAKVCHTKPRTRSESQFKKNKSSFRHSTNSSSSNQPGRRQIHEVTDARDTFVIDTVEKETSEPWFVDLTITNLDHGGKADAKFKIDTGADVNVINKFTWLSLGRPKLSQGGINLTSPGGELEVKGKFDAQIRDIKTNIFVIGNNVDNLLSRDTASALKLIQRIDQVKFSAVKCTPVKIKIKSDATPYSVATARRVPIPLQSKVKKELERMKELDIIEEVTEPTDWVSPMVPVPKANGDVRICVDLRKLNQAVIREKYIIPTFDDIIHQLRGSTIFSKLDAQSGFWQLPLDPETAKLTTFITPYGRFYMKRVPFGISSAPEIFMRVVSEILQGIEGVICYFDDILCYSKTKEEHENLLAQVHKRLEEASLQLNAAKCEYRKSEITFLGHVIDANGCKPDPRKVEAIKDMSEPKDTTELRRYLGMVNYLCRYIPHLSTVSKPLNLLLMKETAWTWGPEQMESFKKIREMLTTAPLLAYFDPSKPTVVEADSSSYGIGGCLLQEFDDGLRPIAYCSRTLTSAEQKYAQIEKECLASVWACERFERYLMGLDTFTLLTDHKPLVPLINSKDLSETPIRCQRMLIRLMRYKPKAEYRPGTTMVTSDTLSRCPSKILEIEQKLQNDVQFHVDVITSTWPITDEKLKEIKAKTQEDPILKTAFEYTISGWPMYKEDVKLAARELYGIRNELSVVDGLLLRGDCIIIPYKMRKEILSKIHDGHPGITKSRGRAKQAVWWTGISKDIQQMVSQCRHCLEKSAAQQKEPLMTSELPDRPFQKIAVDICELNRETYLVSVDYYSRYIDINKLNSITSNTVINKMKMNFSQHGIPETVISDNGTQFTSQEFKNFSAEWNFHHITSSPHYPQANGEAERAVQTAKKILQQKDQHLALLTYRATPIPSLRKSPAELAFGRRLRTRLPMMPNLLTPNGVNHEQLKLRDERAKVSQKRYFDQHTHLQPNLHPGDPVLIKHDGEKKWKQQGVIINQCAPRSYNIQTAGGQVRRNRRHLKSFPSGYQHLQESTPDDTVTDQPESLSDSETTQDPVSDAQPPHPPGVPPDSSSMREVPGSTSLPYVTRSGRAVTKPSRFREL